MKHLAILCCAILTGSLLAAQPGPFPASDLDFAFHVCTDTTLGFPDLEDGAVADLGSVNNGCLLSLERNGAWLWFRVATAGRVGFTIQGAAACDMDFAVWGPFTDLPDTLLTAPLRCSYAEGTEPTGAAAGVTDLSENASGDGWVSAITVQVDQLYVMYMNNYSLNGAQATLSWQFLEGASLECAPPPEAAYALSSDHITEGGAIDMTDLSTGDPFAWYWELPGSSIGTSLAQDPQAVQYNVPGCYDVTLTAYNAAGENVISTTCQVLVDAGTGVDERAQGTFRITQDGHGILLRPAQDGAYHLMVVDALGRTVHTAGAQGPARFATGELPSGLLFFSVEQGGARKVQRVVVR